MAKTGYVKEALTGGGSDALDGIDGSTLLDGDFCFTWVSGVLYFHILNASYGDVPESSPTLIKPDTNYGTKMWEKQSPNDLWATFSRGGTIVNTIDYLSAGTNVAVWYATCACRVTAITARRVGGTGATVNARKNGLSNHLVSDLSLTSSEVWATDTNVQNTDYEVGDTLEIMLVTVTGNITQVAIQVDFTKLS